MFWVLGFRFIGFRFGFQVLGLRTASKPPSLESLLFAASFGIRFSAFAIRCSARPRADLRITSRPHDLPSQTLVTFG